MTGTDEKLLKLQDMDLLGTLVEVQVRLEE